MFSVQVLNSGLPIVCDRLHAAQRAVLHKLQRNFHANVPNLGECAPGAKLRDHA